MSPVSLGRKNKSGNKRGRSPQPRHHTDDLDEFDLNEFDLIPPGLPAFEPDARPAWFDVSIDAILTSGARSLLDAQAPRQLEDATAALLGEHLHRTLHEEHEGMFFSRWADSLLDAAAHRVRQQWAHEVPCG
jgi:hypothetical protein